MTATRKPAASRSRKRPAGRELAVRQPTPAETAEAVVRLGQLDGDAALVVQLLGALAADDLPNGEAARTLDHLLAVAVAADLACSVRQAIARWVADRDAVTAHLRALGRVVAAPAQPVTASLDELLAMTLAEYTRRPAVTGSEAPTLDLRRGSITAAAVETAAAWAEKRATERVADLGHDQEGAGR